MPTIDVSEKTKSLLEEVKEREQMKSFDGAIRFLLKDRSLEGGFLQIFQETMVSLPKQIIKKAENKETLLSVLDWLKSIPSVMARVYMEERKKEKRAQDKSRGWFKEKITEPQQNKQNRERKISTPFKVSQQIETLREELRELLNKMEKKNEEEGAENANTEEKV